MTSLIYVSSSAVPFSQTDLVELLQTARRNNALIDVTGMLLYKDGDFMQAIEGEDATIDELHTKIERDPRHQGLITLLKRSIQERQFADWSMGFRNLLDPAVRTLPGYNEFLNTPLTGAEFSANPSRAQKLLLTFKQTM